MTPITHYTRLGGDAALRGIVDRFYEKVLDVPGLARHFAGADLERVKRHQTQFIASLLGAPGAVSDEQLRVSHKGLGIRQCDMDQTLLLLRETLEEAGLDASDVGLLVSEMRARTPLVVEG